MTNDKAQMENYKGFDHPRRIQLASLLGDGHGLNRTGGPETNS